VATLTSQPARGSPTGTDGVLLKSPSAVGLSGEYSGGSGDDRFMALTVITDPDAIAPLLDARLRADPVRATVLGTIRLGLTERQCWCALAAGGGMAVRSGPAYPIHLDGSWAPAELDRLAAELTRLPELRGVAGPISVVSDLVERLPIQPTRRTALRLLRLDQLHPPAGVPGQSRPATVEDQPTVQRWYTAFGAEAGTAFGDVDRAVADAVGGGGCWLWLDPDSAVVSLATRRPVIAGSARVGPVYTPAQYRGHGYGSAVTTVATRDILDDGGIPVLFTDLANPTSNDIYQRLGYQPVEDRLQIELR